MRRILAVQVVIMSVGMVAHAAVLEQWDMNGNGDRQYSLTTGLNLGGHYNSTRHAFPQTPNDGEFVFSPTNSAGFSVKNTLTSSMDLSVGVVTLSMAFSDINWSGSPINNNSIGFRLYESDAADAEYIGLKISDVVGSSERIRAGLDNFANLGGSENYGRYGFGLTVSETYNAVVEIDYANNEIRLSGAWDSAGQTVLTNTVDFAAAGFSTLANFQTRYVNWSTGDTMVIDDISISQVPEPSVIGLMAIFGGGLWFARRRSRN